jgi:murein DD-endopeptidase MepM/ murein hydrolase activator NlpD
MVEEIASSDRRRLEEMSAAAEAVAEAQEALAAEKDALEATKDELDDLQKELDAKRKEADELIQELLTRGDELEAMYGELEAMESELDREIAQKEKEYNEAKRKEWEAYMATYTTVPPETTAPPTTGSTNNSTGTNTGTNTDTTTEPTTGTNSGSTGEESGGNNSNNNSGSGATWLRPCSYRKLTSPFGNREQPTAGASTYHEGVDLAGPEGTPIYATRAGVVTTARSSNAGGNYVTINHGDGFSSSYLHLRNYVVRKGQAVSAGQLIGYMGSTGISTGSHLHFAIYYNGRAVNPAKYVNLS